MKTKRKKKKKKAKKRSSSEGIKILNPNFALAGRVRQMNPKSRGHGEGGRGWQPPPKGEDGRGARSEPPSCGEAEGFNFNAFVFHTEKGNGRATQRTQRKEAPPKGGRQHHQKKEGIAAIGRRHHRPKEGGEGEVPLSLLVVLPSSPSFGWGWFPEKKTGPKGAGEKAPRPKGGGGQAAPPNRREEGKQHHPKGPPDDPTTRWGQFSEKQNHKKNISRK